MMGGNRDPRCKINIDQQKKQYFFLDMDCYECPAEDRLGLGLISPGAGLSVWSDP